MTEINLTTQKIAIITSKKRYDEAEKIFMDMVNKKEAKKGWFVATHRFSNKNGKINRVYLFKNESGNEHQLAALHLLTEPDMTGMEFDYIIALDNNINYEGRYRKDIEFI